MPQTFKYVNLNEFPVFLPDGRGGQVMFRPRESTARGWFARFLARGQLTKMSVDQPINRVPKPTPEPVSSPSINIGNVGELAQAIAGILATQKVVVQHTTVSQPEKAERIADDFNDRRSSAALAEAMTTEHTAKSSNFKKLGGSGSTDRRADADETVGLLAGLE